jgi:predicted small secreted protein
MKSGRTLVSAALVLSALALSACGETPQTASAAGVKVDSPVYQGVGVSQYAAPGWTAGDRTSWQAELKARAQRGQNDYSRMSN